MNKGAIIIGYQGVGKSTLANTHLGFIDLESGDFKNGTERYDDWYLTYCKIALSIANQGYTVLVSSHKEVRRYFNTVPDINVPIIACIPSESLEDDWIQKLETRYNESKSTKDYRAWMNAKEGFKQSIKEIKESNTLLIKLKSMDYDLYEEIQTLLSRIGKN